MMLGYFNQFFLNFEQSFSYFYLLFFLAFTLFIIIYHFKFFFKPLKGHAVEILIIFIMGALFISSFGFFGDNTNSRSEDYKLAAKYYLEDTSFNLCNLYDGNKCIEENHMNKAPGYPFLLSIFFGIFGTNDDNAIFFNFFLAIFSAIFLYILSYALSNSKLISIFLTLLYTTSWEYLFFGTQTAIVNITCFFLLFSFFAIYLYLKGGTHKLIKLPVVLLMWLAFIRSEYIFLLVIILIMFHKDLLKAVRQEKIIWIFLSIILLFCVSHNLFETTGEHTGPEGTFVSISNFFSTVIDIFYSNGIFDITFLAGVFIFSIVYILKSIRCKDFSSLGLFPAIHVALFTILVLSFHTTFEDSDRYFAMIYPSFVLTLGLIYGKIDWRKSFRDGIYLILFLLLICAPLSQMLSLFAEPNPPIVPYKTSDFEKIVTDLEGEDTIFIFPMETFLSRYIFFGGVSKATTVNGLNELISEKGLPWVKNFGDKNIYYVTYRERPENKMILEQFNYRLMEGYYGFQVYQILYDD